MNWPELKHTLARARGVIADEARSAGRMANLARDYSPRAAAILRDYAEASEQLAKLCNEYHDEQPATPQRIGRP